MATDCGNYKNDYLPTNINLLVFISLQVYRYTR